MSVWLESQWGNIVEIYLGLHVWFQKFFLFLFFIYRNTCDEIKSEVIWSVIGGTICFCYLLPWHAKWCLQQVISKLTDGKATHIPYRDSKLTRLLQSSLSGHGRVSVCISAFRFILGLLTSWLALFGLRLHNWQHSLGIGIKKL